MSDLTLHTHTAGEAGLFVNSYIAETENGLVVVDTSLLNSDIAALVDRVAALGKPLLGVFVTHAHPDHFNGVHVLVAGRDVPVHATTAVVRTICEIAVARTICEIADAKRAQWGPVYGAEWPAETGYPSVELKDGDEVLIDGVSWSVREVGPAESHADSVVRARTADGEVLAIIGDLAFHGVHPYTADGHGARWLDVLAALPEELSDARVLYPGHGTPAGPELLTAQRRYLLHYRSVVQELCADGGTLDEAAKAELEAKMCEYLPEAPLTWMIGLGADAVAAELAAESC
jgi:glyoxylase-like metal-dependent hydrolase (beta-lactamase superfamily II)